MKNQKTNLKKDLKNEKFNLERFYGFIQVERIPLEYRAKKCHILIRGFKFNEVPGFTHLIYLVKRNKDIVCVIGGIRNPYKVKKNFSAYVYLCKDFFFPNIPAERIIKEKDYHIAKFAMLEMEKKTSFSHTIKNGRNLLGNCLKIHTSVYDEVKNKKEKTLPLVEEPKRNYSFSPALKNIGGRQTVKLEDYF